MRSIKRKISAAKFEMAMMDVLIDLILSGRDAPDSDITNDRVDRAGMALERAERMFLQACNKWAVVVELQRRERDEIRLDDVTVVDD